MQQTTGAITGFDDSIKVQNQSIVFSVLGCLQCSFSSENLKERIETSLVNGLRRSAGLNLLNFTMNLDYNKTRIFDLVQWLQGALRNNRMQQTHYLSGAEGCGAIAEQGIQEQFFQILGHIIQVLKHESLDSTTEYVHLINALCWNFTRSDHEALVKVELFKTLCRGDGNIMHPLFRAWGQEDSNFQLELEKKTNFCLASRVRQVFEFLTQNILEGVFVKKELENLDLGTETKMLVKEESIN